MTATSSRQYQVLAALLAAVLILVTIPYLYFFGKWVLIMVNKEWDKINWAARKETAKYLPALGAFLLLGWTTFIAMIRRAEWAGRGIIILAFAAFLFAMDGFLDQFTLDIVPPPGKTFLPLMAAIVTPTLLTAWAVAMVRLALIYPGPILSRKQ
jgi:hypothetical protein